MNISKNIRYILTDNNLWSPYTNKSYRAKIQKADKTRIYNAEGKPGFVYNVFEDSYAEVNEDGLIVTGVAGEMWPIGESSLKKYNVSIDQLSFEPIEVDTVETGDVFCGVQIPVKTEFTLETDYGIKVMLKGNRPGIEHGNGDIVLVSARTENGRYIPDFSDSGRIVNGAIFDKLYKALR